MGQVAAQQPADPGTDTDASAPDAEGDAPQTEQGDTQVTPQAPAQRPKVLLLPTDSVRGELTKLVPERIDDATRARLREQGDVEVMPSFDEIRRQLAGQGVSSAAIYEAEQLYASGIGLITAGKNEQAAANFERAVDLVTQNLPDLKNYGVLADALANLSLAYFLRGDDLDARRRMQQFAHLRPSDKLNADKYPQELIDVLTEEQAKIKKAGPGKLVITSDVPGATIFVDGTERGAAPLTLTDVGFGYHYVVARAPNSDATWHEVVRVKGRAKEQTVAATFGGEQAVAQTSKDGTPSYYTDLLATLRTGTFTTQELQPYLAELSRQSGAPYIAWMLVYKSGMDYKSAPFVWRAEDGKMVAVPEATFNFELSDLNVRVNALAQDIAQAIATMPEDRATTSVSIAPKAVSVATTTPSTTVDPGATTQPAFNPPAVVIEDTGESEDDDDTWLYVGAGTAAVVVVGGLVAGSLLLWTGDEEASAASGFSAEVSW